MSPPGNIRRETDYFAKIPFWLQDLGADAYVLTVYAAIYRSADWNPDDDDTHRGAFPSQATLAARAGCGVTSVKRAIALLEQWGVLDVERRPGLTAEYSLRTTKPDHLAATRLGTQSSGGSLVSRLAATTENPLPKPINQEKRADPKRSADVLWEIFVGIHGQPATDTERGKYNKAVAMLRNADVGPWEYPRLVQAFTSKHDGLQPGVMTVVNRVGELRHYLDNGPVRAPGPKQIIEEQTRRAAIEAAETKGQL